MNKNVSPRQALTACLSLAFAFLCGVTPGLAEASRRHWSGSTLSISGTPATSVVSGSPYAFVPTVNSTSTALSYSIGNKPAWAAFSIATGTLSGTPASTQVGSYSNVTMSVSNGSSIATLAPFGITVTAPAVTNVPPVISGSPLTSVLAGKSYSFRPTATDANGDSLTFSVSGKPAWAGFDATTGQLSGTSDASYVGNYANIVISVSDGKASASLAAFSLTVNSIALGSASLTWTPPMQNTDGSSLTNLAGYTIYYGTNPASLGSKVLITNPGVTAYLLGNLSGGTYYFGVTANAAGGAESALSNIGSKTIL